MRCAAGWERFGLLYDLDEPLATALTPHAATGYKRLSRCTAQRPLVRVPAHALGLDLNMLTTQHVQPATFWGRPVVLLGCCRLQCVSMQLCM